MLRLIATSQTAKTQSNMHSVRVNLAPMPRSLLTTPEVSCGSVKLSWAQTSLKLLVSSLTPALTGLSFLDKIAQIAKEEPTPVKSFPIPLRTSFRSVLTAQLIFTAVNTLIKSVSTKILLALTSLTIS